MVPLISLSGSFSCNTACHDQVQVKENWIHYDSDDKLSSARIVQHNGSKEKTLNKRMKWPERIENKIGYTKKMKQ